MEQKGEKVLVTGAAGFIGQELCRQLRYQGYRVNILVRDNAANRLIGTESESCTCFTGDICQPETLREPCSGVTTVFHLAAISQTRGIEAEEFNRVNIEGTQNLLNAALENGVSHFIFYSSSLADPDIPQTSYGRSKRLAEQSVLSVTKSGPMSSTILRPVNVYGTNMQGGIRNLIRIMSRPYFPRLPRLENRLSLVSTEDLCKATLLAAESKKASGKIYYVTDGQSYGINEIEDAVYALMKRTNTGIRCPKIVLFLAALAAESIGKLSGKPYSVGLRTYKNLVQDNLFSNAEINADLAFEPRLTLYDKLPEIIRSLQH